MDSRRKTPPALSRRDFLKALGCCTAAAAAGLGLPAARARGGLHLGTIPSTGETIPAVGMGTWVTFNVGDDRELLDHRTENLRTFFELGGGMIDCSPRYGSSADAVGYGLAQLRDPGSGDSDIEDTDSGGTDISGLFSAEKVWRSFTADAGEQIDRQARRWGWRPSTWCRSTTW